MSSRRASASAAIAAIARALGDDLTRVVFVIVTVTALYPLDGGADVRPTVDVDCVIDVATTAEYYAFVDGFRARGFREWTDEAAPLCRWVCAGIRVDITATVDTGIGPTNRWYRDAVANAATYSVANDIDALAITPIFFVATKLEAFRARGNADFLASHDLEDLLTVIAGLAPLRDEIVASTTEVTRSVHAELRELARNKCIHRRRACPLRRRRQRTGARGRLASVDGHANEAVSSLERRALVARAVADTRGRRAIAATNVTNGQLTQRASLPP